jgi:hypothetical protein
MPSRARRAWSRTSRLRYSREQRSSPRLDRLRQHSLFERDKNARIARGRVHRADKGRRRKASVHLPSARVALILAKSRCRSRRRLCQAAGRATTSRSRKSGSQQTLCWREVDSNRRSPREEKAHLRCPKRNSAPRGDAHRRRRPSRDFFLKRSGPVSPGSDIAAAYRNGERILIPNGSDTLAERR